MKLSIIKRIIFYAQDEMQSINALLAIKSFNDVTVHVAIIQAQEKKSIQT